MTLPVFPFSVEQVTIFTYIFSLMYFMPVETWKKKKKKRREAKPNWEINREPKRNQRETGG